MLVAMDASVYHTEYPSVPSVLVLNVRAMSHGSGSSSLVSGTASSLDLKRNSIKRESFKVSIYIILRQQNQILFHILFFFFVKKIICRVGNKL